MSSFHAISAQLLKTCRLQWSKAYKDEPTSKAVKFNETKVDFSPAKTLQNDPKRHKTTNQSMIGLLEENSVVFQVRLKKNPGNNSKIIKHSKRPILLKVLQQFVGNFEKIVWIRTLKQLNYS